MVNESANPLDAFLAKVDEHRQSIQFAMLAGPVDRFVVLDGHFNVERPAFLEEREKLGRSEAFRALDPSIFTAASLDEYTRRLRRAAAKGGTDGLIAAMEHVLSCLGDLGLIVMSEMPSTIERQWQVPWNRLNLAYTRLREHEVNAAEKDKGGRPRKKGDKIRAFASKLAGKNSTEISKAYNKKQRNVSNHITPGQVRSAKKYGKATAKK